MKTDMNITVELSPADIKKAISAYVKTNPIFKDAAVNETDIVINVNTHYERGTSFQSAIVSVKAEPVRSTDRLPYSRDYMDR